MHQFKKNVAFVRFKRISGTGYVVRFLINTIDSLIINARTLILRSSVSADVWFESNEWRAPCLQSIFLCVGCRQLIIGE